MRVALIGDAGASTAYARVNALWRDGLIAAGFDVVNDNADVTIHHDYVQHFATCPAGHAPCRIAVRTWDFGPYPRAWAARIGRDFHRLWVHSEWTRDKAIEGGVPPELIDVVPHGVDPRVFQPGGPSHRDHRFTFLFAGATVPRKGIDTLLRAYAAAFRADDPVRLILKGHSADVFYRGQHLSEAIEQFRVDAAMPALEHIDAYLPAEELAALYRSADAGVFPYRAEGFAIPILEAMACGLPCIVPRFGACLDYCSDDNAFFVDGRRIRLPVRRDMVFNTLGFREQIDRVDFCEVTVDALVARLRQVYEMSVDERRQRGASASAVRHRYSLAAIDRRLVELLDALARPAAMR